MKVGAMDTADYRRASVLRPGERVMARRLKSAPRTVGVSVGRNENLLAILFQLRHGDLLTCSELSHRTGLAAPTIHRLLATLVNDAMVTEDPDVRVTGGPGRPASSFRFNRSVVSVAGVDVGAETTRVAIAGADGTIVASRSLPTTQVVDDLPTQLGLVIDSLMSSLSNQAGPLIGVGVGVAGSLDPVTGVMSRAFIHQQLVGLPIREMLEERLACSVVVEKDDHLSILAEVSDRGTVPGASSLVVVNYGRGIGLGLIADGVVIKGMHGQAGRIVRWPSTVVPGATLRDDVALDAMLATYRSEGGRHSATDGKSLCELARGGDAVAESTIRRAAQSLAGVFLHLATVFDPEHMVLGGGFAGSFDLFDQSIRESLSVLAFPPRVLPTVIGSDAVVVGGLLVADQFIESWLAAQVVG
jgi:glucokinase